MLTLAANAGPRHVDSRQPDAGTYPDPRREQHFRTWLTQAEADAIPAPPIPLPFFHLLVNDKAYGSADEAARTRTLQQANWAHAAPYLTQTPPLDSQSLSLRACSGPLAGLEVHAHWQGPRLALRFSATASAMAERLQRQQQALVTVLSSALGVEVAVEVTYEK